MRKPRKPPLPGVHPGVHPVVHFIDDAIAKSGRSMTDVYLHAGVGKNLIADWRRGRCAPSHMNVEAILGALGFRFEVVPKAAEKPK